MQQQEVQHSESSMKYKEQVATLKQYNNNKVAALRQKCTSRCTYMVIIPRTRTSS